MTDDSEFDLLQLPDLLRTFDSRLHLPKKYKCVAIEGKEKCFGQPPQRCLSVLSRRFLRTLFMCSDGSIMHATRSMGIVLRQLKQQDQADSAAAAAAPPSPPKDESVADGVTLSWWGLKVKVMGSVFIAILYLFNSTFDPARTAPSKPSSKLMNTLADLFSSSAPATTAQEREELCMLILSCGVF